MTAPDLADLADLADLLQVQPVAPSKAKALLAQEDVKADVDAIVECYRLDAADEKASLTVARARNLLFSIEKVSKILAGLLGKVDPLLAQALGGQIYAELDVEMIAKIEEAVTRIYGEGERSPKVLVDHLVALGDLAKLLPATLPPVTPGGGRAGSRFAKQYGSAKAHLAANALALFERAHPGEVTTTEGGPLHELAERLLALAEDRPFAWDATSMLRHIG